MISIHAPRTGSDVVSIPKEARVIKISIHAPRTGSDTVRQSVGGKQKYFNPRSPHGERPSRRWCWMRRTDFNPRSPHGERQSRAWNKAVAHRISIHAPRTGSDGSVGRFAQEVKNFNPRSPHGERPDPAPGTATPEISIHAPRTGSDALTVSIWKPKTHFNPRSPHGERPFFRHVYRICGLSFQSTLPARGATLVVSVGMLVWIISIHAPRTGSDGEQVRLIHAPFYFNPRSPHGERPAVFRCRASCDAFQSTLPARGATVTISISFSPPSHFNPRSPHGERPAAGISGRCQTRFQSTLPARGATWMVLWMLFALQFQSTLPARGATNAVSPEGNLILFQSTLPARGATAAGTKRGHEQTISIHAPRTGSDG